jgi:GDP/UDP-N,N'-diacetylbacillosamine 2-epimerase (hydrolysing)
MPKRRAAFITGARSEYDILYPVARACTVRDDIEPCIVAGAGHLSGQHGDLELVRADGIEIAAAIDSLEAGDGWVDRARAFGKFYQGVCDVLARRRPDLVVVAGDREEALAGALTGVFLQIPVAHLFGGDRCIASDIDEVFRPAISKLSHLHFAATEGHRERLIRMGERPDHVWAVGATSLDRLADEPLLDRKQLGVQLGTDLSGPFFLLIQHPSPTLNLAETGREMNIVLDAVLGLGHLVFCSYPNFDPGNIAMREAIDTAAKQRKTMHTFNTLPRNLFVNLFRHCSAIVGNSSSIVIEAGFLRVAGILVGPRQNLREVGSNVIRVEIYKSQIRDACHCALGDESFRRNVQSCTSVYGDGRSAPRVAALLATLNLDWQLLTKTISY